MLKKGLAGSVCPDPGVMEEQGQGVLGPWVSLPVMLGIFSGRAALRGSSRERSQGMYPRCSQHWVLQA